MAAMSEVTGLYEIVLNTRGSRPGGFGHGGLDSPVKEYPSLLQDMKLVTLEIFILHGQSCSFSNIKL